MIEYEQTYFIGKLKKDFNINGPNADSLVNGKAIDYKKSLSEQNNINNIFI